MQEINDHLREWRKEIYKNAQNILAEMHNQAVDNFNGDHYIFKELQVASQMGKAWRGGLCFLAAESFGAKDMSIVGRVAGLIEIIHYSLLIHDDIIDETAIRRDTLSFPARLKAIFDGRGALAPEKQGLGTAVAVGDYVLQYALNQIINLETDNKVEVTSLFLDILTQTTRAQIFDSATHEPVLDMNEVLHLYEAKTGAYSFTLPMLAGMAISDNQDETVRLFLKTIGESLGIIMQAFDDMAGFNEPRAVKNLIEDINNKQPTLWCALLIPQLNAEEREKFNYIFWLDHIPYGHVNYIKELGLKYKIREHVLDIVNDRAELCHDLIQDLPFSKQNRRLWHQFIGLVQSYSGV